MRFTQAYANSAVCSATRTALITGRYQYRLPVGLEEPLGNARRRPAAATIRRCPRCCATRGYETGADRQVAPGRAAELRPAQERLRRISGASAAARSTISRHASRGQRRPVGRRHADRAGRLPDRPARRSRASARSAIYAPAGKPVLHQPAFQRAALAVGRARRRGRIEAPRSAQDRRAACRTSTAARRHLCAHGDAHGRAGRPRARRRSSGSGSTATRSSSSPATMAASASPTPGRSPAEDRAARRRLRIPAIVRWPGRDQRRATQRRARS